MSLPAVTAKRIVTEWMSACREIAARNGRPPWASFTRTDEHYIILLQEMIAKEIERIQQEGSWMS